MLFGRARNSPRPVALWLRKLPTWIFLALSGFILPMPILFAYSILTRDRGATHTIAFDLFITWGALWSLFSIWLTGCAFDDGGPLSDAAIQHGKGLIQRIARSAFGSRDAVGPVDRGDTASQLQGLDLLDRD